MDSRPIVPFDLFEDFRPVEAAADFSVLPAHLADALSLQHRRDFHANKVAVVSKGGQPARLPMSDRDCHSGAEKDEPGLGTSDARRSE
jgi:hypothetical protein